MSVHDVEAGGGRFEQDEVAIDERRNSAVGVQPKVVGVLLALCFTIHENEFVGDIRLFEQDVRGQVGVSWLVI